MQYLKKIPVLTSILLMIAFWQVAAMLYGNPALFPAVSDLLVELWRLLITVSFYASIGMTILRGLAGFLVALGLSIVLAAIALHHTYWKSFIHPWLVTVRSVPVIAIVLIALLWLSPPNLPAFIAFFTMFPILYQHILSGLEHTDIRLIEMARVFGKNAMQRLLLIYFPAAKKHVFAGISTAMGFGWRAVIIGEVLAGPVKGIGTGMKRAQAFIEMPKLLAWTAVAIIISFGFEYIIKLIEKRAEKSQLKQRGTETIAESHINDLKSFKINNLTVKFKDISLFNNLSKSFQKGNVYLIKSPSGSGKTTLLRVVAGLTKLSEGNTDYNHDIKISYSFQDIRLIPWLTIEENIAFACPTYPTVTLKQLEKIRELAEDAGISDQLDKLPATLSGGQQQRATLIRALSADCNLLLLDEPLNGLDNAMKSKIIRLIEKHCKHTNPIVIWSTHENPEEFLTSEFEIITLPDPVKDIR